MKNYYGLVASMPDVSPDDAKLNFTVADFKEDYWPQLSETDKKLVALFFLRYDPVSYTHLTLPTICSV